MLPPPNWTPTGNSGTWVWHEKGEYDKGKKAWRPCYRWCDGVYGYEWQAGLDVMKGRKAGLFKSGKKSWFKRLKDRYG